MTITPTATTSGVELSTVVPIASMRGGGLNILLRHGVSDVGTEAQITVLADCSTQANLNEQAKRDLAQMGADLKTLGIADGEVFSSPYCRTVETAKIVFGRVPTSEDALLRPAYTPPAGQPVPPPVAERIDKVRKLLGVVPPSGNVWFVTHGEVIRTATGFDVAMGEALIVRPDGRGTFAAVARILPLRWKP